MADYGNLRIIEWNDFRIGIVAGASSGSSQVGDQLTLTRELICHVAAVTRSALRRLFGYQEHTSQHANLITLQRGGSP
jgi:hypothetical protein